MLRCYVVTGAHIKGANSRVCSVARFESRALARIATHSHSARKRVKERDRRAAKGEPTQGPAPPFISEKRERGEHRARAGQLRCKFAFIVQLPRRNSRASGCAICGVSSAVCRAASGGFRAAAIW